MALGLCRCVRARASLQALADEPRSSGALSSAFDAALSLLMMAGGLVLILTPRRHWWFWGACGVFVIGSRLLPVTSNRYLGPLVRWLSLTDAVLAMCGANVIAGILALVGALVTLPRAFGLIVAVGAFAWTWGWGAAFVGLLRGEREMPPGSG